MNDKMCGTGSDKNTLLNNSAIIGTPLNNCNPINKYGINTYIRA